MRIKVNNIILESLDLSVSDIARLTGKDAQDVSKTLKGQRRNPAIRKLIVREVCRRIEEKFFDEDFEEDAARTRKRR